ncbi:MAG TPA: hypothetical protein VFK58_06040 [Sphingomicrobium sp.]|nr:hypothetical protein [Sphingomicrobium sp.]
MIAAIALAVLLLAIGVALFLQGRNGDDDRLTGNETAATGEDPEQRCSGQATYDRIKRELFRRAAEVRGSDQAAFERIGSYSSLRVEAPILRDENKAVGSVTCSATFWLDLPPGVAVVGGRTSLSAEILYTIQPAADGSGNVITLANAEEIITPLATLTRTGASAPGPGEAPASEGAPPSEPSDPLAPPIQSAPAPPAPPAAPEPPRPSANPSFNCANARTAGEIAVCRSPGLAALDRTMAAQYSAAIASADPAQRAILQRTRDAFLRYRDNCPNEACIAQTYRGRMREIRDIMAGSWRP